MPDFTVIEGGGEPPDWNRELSQQHLETFIVTLLRNLAAGDASYRVTEAFFRFFEHAQEKKVPLAPVFNEAIRSLHEQCFRSGGEDSYEAELEHVLQAALRVTAESMANDNAARARRSKREDDLRHAIEAKVLGSERRSRENGWSYVENLTKHLGRKPTRRR